MPNTAYVRAAIPHQTREQLTQSELKDIVVTAWRRRLGAVLNPPRRPVAATYAVNAAVSLTGGELAAVVLSVPYQVAKVAAGTALDLHQDEVAPGDVEDILGEVIVAIGAGLRHGLSGIAGVGAPVIVQGEDVRSSVPGARMISEITLNSIAGPVHVSVWGARLARL